MRDLPNLRLDRLALLALVALAPACDDNDDELSSSAPGATANTSFASVLDAQGLTTLRTALVAAGLDTALESGGPYTLLAPSEAAFAALPPGVLDDLLLPQNQQALADLLSYHVVVGELDSVAISAQPSAATLLGPDVQIDSFGALFINEAQVENPDVQAQNGVIHVIDTVLSQPVSVIDTLNARGFTTLVTAIDAAGLTGAVNGGSFTVLAPTDAAFAALPPGVLDDLLMPQNQTQLISVLQYHLVAGPQKVGELFAQGDVVSVEGPLHFVAGSVAAPTINGVALSPFNVPATDGLVHGVESVLLPPSDLVATLQAEGYNTLATAIQAAGLESTLQGTGPFTLFAPTDAAFAALDPTVLSGLLNDPPALANILTYHVLGDAMQAREVRLEATVTSLQGGMIVVDPLGGFITLDATSDVTRPDVFASNGILHEIDAVLMP